MMTTFKNNVKKSSIRTAELTDTNAIKELLTKARYVHRHLDWRDPIDWITHDVFLVEENSRKKINAVFSCTSELNDIYWVRLFACKNSLNYFTSWDRLFRAGIERLTILQPAFKIFSLAYFEWMIKLFELEGWNEIEHIIQFQWDNGKRKQYLTGEKNSHIRNIESEDLESIYRIDTNGFEPEWQQSVGTISASLRQGKYRTVFVDQGKVLGFQISTINNNRAHLARIAVDTNHRREKIGEQLVSDLLRFCVRTHIENITVNTQQSNTSSTALYHKLGFVDTGNTYPIFSY